MATVSTEPDLSPLRVPRSLAGGKYVLQRRLGAGAMGEVWHARHTALEKGVAIKLLHASVTKRPKAVARFRREALAASRFEHRNSTRVLDFGEEDGTCYIVMELLDGQSMGELVESEGPLALDRAVSLLSQVLSALAVAHDAGIIHRDLKPDNVMVVGGLDDLGHPEERAKVCDFGIAKLFGPTNSETLTQDGSVAGTPHYMSPEQCQGKKLDARSDLYAVGVMLYRLLTGEVPFNGENPFAIVYQHVTEEPPKVRAKRPDLPKEVDAFIGQAMAKGAGERFQSAREMRAALLQLVGIDTGPQVVVTTQSYAAGTATARHPTTEPTIEQSALAGAVAEPADRRSALMVAGLAVVLAASVGAAVWAGLGGDASKAGGQAAAPAAVAAAPGAAAGAAPDKAEDKAEDKAAGSAASAAEREAATTGGAEAEELAANAGGPPTKAAAGGEAAAAGAKPEAVPGALKADGAKADGAKAGEAKADEATAGEAKAGEQAEAGADEPASRDARQARRKRRAGRRGRRAKAGEAAAGDSSAAAKPAGATEPKTEPQAGGAAGAAEPAPAKPSPGTGAAAAGATGPTAAQPKAPEANSAAPKAAEPKPADAKPAEPKAAAPAKPKAAAPAQAAPAPNPVPRPAFNPEPAVRVTLSSLSGGLSKRAVQRALAPLKGKALACWQGKARAANTTRRTTVTLRFVVDEDGRLRRIKGSGGPAGLAACVADEAGRLRSRQRPDTGTVDAVAKVVFAP